MAKVKMDPVTLEILMHRLWQITSEMAATIVNVSGSVVSTEARDYMIALFNSEGTTLMTGCGVTLHGATGTLGVKHIIDKYSESPGINDGDVWIINDTDICNPHQPDVYVLTPFHYQGKLVGWSGSMTHLVDIGSLDPGGFSPGAREIYHEGFRIRGIKIVEHDEIRNDIMDTLLCMSRDPGMVGLDMKAQFAAGVVAKRRVLEIIEEYGLDTYEALCEEVVKYTEARLRARLRELPDGTWRTIGFWDNDGLTDRIYQIVLSMTKEGNSLTFDYTGTSEQSPTYINCARPAARGGVFTAVSTLLGYDMPWNEGIMNPVKLIIPDGTMISATVPAPRALGSIGGHLVTQNAALLTISQMLLCSEKYRHDAVAQWTPSVPIMVPAGVNQRGQFGVTQLMEANGGGMGARCYADGVDAAAMFVIPETVMPNVERVEFMFPLLYLFRREAIDCGGPGMFRGGVPVEYAITLHDAPLGEIRAQWCGNGSEAAIGVGLCGGYAAANWKFRVIRDSDVNQRIKQGKLPKRVEELKGTLEILPPQFSDKLKNNDVFYYHVCGGGGYGDPIDRDPEAVRKDVINRKVSIESAEKMYGVVIEPETLEVDKVRTEQVREAIRKNRLEVSGKAK